MDSNKEIFSTIIANEPEELKAVFNLRYQIYNTERHMASEKNLQDADFVEQDIYDSHSIYCLLKHNPTNQFIGTARLVTNHPLLRQHNIPVFPTEDLFDLNRILSPELSASCAELSRFCISKNLREKLNFSFDDNIAMLELLKGVLKLSAEKNISHIFAISSPSLLRMVKYGGMIHDRYQMMIEYYGTRNPAVFHPLEIYKYNVTHNTLSSEACFSSHKHFKQLAEAVLKENNICPKCNTIANELISGKI